MQNLWQDLRYGARMLMKNSGFTLIAVGKYLCVICVLLMAGVSLAFGADLKGRFEAYRRAMNSHDLQAVLSFLAADYEFKVANSSYKVAKKDITGQLEWDFSVNARTAYGDIQIKGNTISTVLTEQNDFYKAIGISGRKYQFTYVYNEQGLIKEAILEKSGVSHPSNGIPG